MKKAGLGGLLGRLLGVSRPEQEAIYYLDVERSWSGRGSRHPQGDPGPPRASGPAPESTAPSHPRQPQAQPAPASHLSLSDAARRLEQRRAGQPQAGAAPAAAAAAVQGAPPAAPPGSAAPAPDADVRASSLPQPLAGGAAAAAAQQQEQGSGPGAPVSPDPAARATLRRVSSQPQTVRLSGGSSLPGSSQATDSTPAERLASGSLHLTFSGSLNSREGSRSSRRSSTSGDVPVVPGRAPAPLPAAAALKLVGGGRQDEPSAQREPSHAPPAQQHPALSGASAGAHGSQRGKPAAPHGPYAALQRPTAVPDPLALAAALAAAAAVEEEEEDALSPRHLLGGPAPCRLSNGSGSVSLLTYQLKGPSGNTSAAASREASVRAGMSREASIRSSSRRTPVGGLTLALSRENSVKGGQAAALSRESSVRGGSGSVRGGSVRSGSTRGGQGQAAASPLERSVSGGARTYRGLPLAEPRPEPQAFGGRGSCDWMGAPVPARLSAMLDSCEAPAPCQGGAVSDLFAGGKSPPVSVRASAPIPEDEREGLLDIQPQEVGSWAGRVTTFTNARPAAAPGATHAGGPDPLLLTAALQALAGAPGGQSGGDDCRKQLVGDSELANTTELSTDMTGGAVHLALHGGSWQHSGASRSAGASGGHEAHLLSSSWDAADGAGAVGVRLAALEVHAQLVGSAPTRGAASSPPPSAHGSAGGLRHRTLSQPLPPLPGVAPGDAEWNRSFMKRWRAVKKRAYLQALGLRALWRVNSPSDRHEPLELLMDEPQCDLGMRRAPSLPRVSEAAAARCGGGAASAARPLLRRPSSGALHKDPSLSALLLGEVAEVC